MPHTTTASLKSMSVSEGGVGAYARSIWPLCLSSSQRWRIRPNMRSTPSCLRWAARSQSLRSSNALLRSSRRPGAADDRRQAELQHGSGQVPRPWRRWSGASPVLRSASVAALELAFPVLNFDLPWLSFGRIRPLHTSAVIFAFGGNVLIATSFYVVQRTCRARLAGDMAPWFVVLGYNFFIVIAGTGYLLGITQAQGIRRARMVCRSVAHRRMGRRICWCSSAPSCGGRNRTSTSRTGSISPSSSPSRSCISATMPRSRSRCSRRNPTSSGPACRMPMVQWWYGHNAVGFFLTAGFLAIMYYFIPKRADRPIYSLPAVDHSLLGADLSLHLGRPASPALHGAAGLGVDARHDLLDHAVDALTGAA